MKMWVSAVVATGMLAASVAGVSAKDQHGPYHYYRPAPPPPHVSVGGAVAAGAFLGFALGSILAPPPPVVVYPQPYYYAPPPPAPVYYPPAPVYGAGLTPHQAWCVEAYGPQYDVASDTVAELYGPPFRCVAPGEAAG